MKGLGGRGVCLVFSGCFLGVSSLAVPGSTKPAQHTQDGVTHVG